MQDIWLQIFLYGVATCLVAGGLWSWLLWPQPGPLTIEYSGNVVMQLPLRTVRVIGTVALVIGIMMIRAILK